MEPHFSGSAYDIFPGDLPTMATTIPLLRLPLPEY
jgi:hypothetical protein